MNKLTKCICVCFWVVTCLSPGRMVLAARSDVQRGSAEWKRRVEAPWFDALKQTDQQSGKGITPQEDAAGAVDGVKNGNFDFHTTKQKQPWWQVDLGAAQPLHHILVYNRKATPERARNMQILLSDDAADWRRVYKHDGSVFSAKPLQVRIENQEARYVRLQVTDTTWLHLSEVEVYGSKDGKNLAFHKPATQSSVSQWSSKPRFPISNTAEPGAVPIPSAKRILECMLDGCGNAADDIQKELQALVKAGTPARDPRWAELYADASELRKNYSYADDSGFDEIVFVKRKPYSSDHYYTDINNGTSADRFLPENGIYIYNVRTGRERPVVTAADLPGGKGFIGKISLSFDARKVLFDFRETPRSGFRIWEVGIDGSGLRQVLQPPEDEAQKVARWRKGWHTDDIHPCYLPDGKIIFSSTRSEHTVLCGGSAHLAAPSLYRVNADGTQVEKLSDSLVSEFCPVVLSDGRVMYHRWEYVDKGARVAKTIWSMNPDGSRCQSLYGVADDTTTVYMYPQALPGDESRIVCVGTCHFPQGGCLGAIMLIDINNANRARGPDPDEADYVQWDDRYSVTNITPHVFIERRTEPGWYFRTDESRYVHDRNGTSGHLYTHPYPVSDNRFLVSYKVDPSDHYKNVPDAYSLYLIDTAGNHHLVHEDDDLSCWHPTPLVAREVPPVIPTVADPENAEDDKALCVVTNIHRGMEGVEPGEVKWIRINEAVPRYWATGRRWGHSQSSSGWKAALWPRVQWGVVPVEEDGSAYFEVPTNRNVFFQALDENFRELQRERTYVNYKPGRVRSCNGCHGDAGRTSVAAAEKPIALTRPPSTLQPQPCDLAENGSDGKPGQVIHYPADIQPIFNDKCVSCHGNDDPAGKLKLTADVTAQYNTSYEQLARKQLAGPIIPEFTSFRQGDQGNYNGAYLPPKSLGSYQSEMIEILTEPDHPKNAQDDHSRMLTENELMVLSRWVDSNYQFYGSYYGRRHGHWTKADPGKPAYKPTDFRREATFEEATSNSAPEWHR